MWTYKIALSSFRRFSEAALRWTLRNINNSVNLFLRCRQCCCPTDVIVHGNRISKVDVCYNPWTPKNRVSGSVADCRIVLALSLKNSQRSGYHGNFTATGTKTRSDLIVGRDYIKTVQSHWWTKKPC